MRYKRQLKFDAAMKSNQRKCTCKQSFVSFWFPAFLVSETTFMCFNWANVIDKFERCHLQILCSIGCEQMTSRSRNLGIIDEEWRGFVGKCPLVEDCCMSVFSVCGIMFVYKQTVVVSKQSTYFKMSNCFQFEHHNHITKQRASSWHLFLVFGSGGAVSIRDT